MDWTLISKKGAAPRIPPNLTDYASAVETFSPEAMAGELDGLPEGGLNIAFEAVGRHSKGPYRDCIALRFLMQKVDDQFRIGPTDPEDPALLHFTSGTTGTPKGAVHVHNAVLMHAMTGKLALDIHPSDIFWCTADPGWVTGTSYGIIAPLTLGATLVVDVAPFDAQRWYRIIEEQRVNVWYTSPTAMMTHSAVAEAGVIGKPDPTAMEIVKAFVSLTPGQIPGEALRRDILAHARRRLGAVVAPKELEFRATLPKTRSGKIMRRLLKAEETGTQPGDLSTLESGSYKLTMQVAE